jgi:hypothetical protein
MPNKDLVYELKSADEVIDFVIFRDKRSKIFLRNEWMYRGHASEKWRLVPTGLREERFANTGETRESDYVSNLMKIYNSGSVLPKRDEFFVRKASALTYANVRILTDFCKILEKKNLIDIQRWLRKDTSDNFYRHIGFVAGSGSDDPVHREFLDFLCLAQHYGLPTTLLDFTLNIITALSFSVFDKKSILEDIPCIWCIDMNSDGINNGSSKVNSPFHLIKGSQFYNKNINSQQGLLIWFRHWFEKYHVSGKFEELEDAKDINKVKVILNINDKCRLKLREFLLNVGKAPYDLAVSYEECARFVLDNSDKYK